MTLKLSPLRWLITLVGMQFLCGIAWVLGPLLPALEPWPVRAVLIMALMLLWAIGNFLLDWRSTQAEVALTQGLTGAAQDEAAAVQERLASALKLLRQTKGKKFNLNEQPWYAIIGPPGAGKTTALLNAGLEFPLAGALGPGAISGVGGTRLCEWWFTNDAVLIDTAGRYTTQDSNESVDRAGWLAFLKLLRRTRPTAPLNGVLIAIALDDLMGENAAAQAAHAQAIRSRIDELEEELGLRLPIYTLLTKSDLMAGFTEFFDDLDRAGREQVWGTTLPLRGKADLARALHPLLDRINQRTLTRLDAEPNADRRALIAGFPAQFAAILPAVQTFLEKTFAPGPDNQVPMLRGVYFTSGTQEGTPIDRLTGALSRAFGLDQRRAARLRPEAGRAYFLAGLLRNVVFREAPLVTHKPGLARRQIVLRIAGYATCLVIAAAGAGFMLYQRATSLATIEAAQTGLNQRTAMAADLPLDPVAESDMVALLPWLDAARTASRAPVATGPDPLGFAQGPKIAGAAETAYRHGLEFALFPRLIWRVESQMRGLLDQPDALYEATRVYLMLGGAGPLDRALVQDWFVREWDETLPGDSNAAARTALAAHLATLLDGALPTLALDGPLVAQARQVIGKVPLAVRAYSRLKPLVAAQDLPPWKPSEALGPAGVRVFLRLSGRGLEEGIPGMFTVQGMTKAVLPALARAAQEAAGEAWVMGQELDAASPQRRTLEADIVALYAADYTAAWDAMLKDLELSPLRSLTQAAQDLFILASQHSPLRSLLAAIGKEVSPAAALPADSPAKKAMAAVDDKFRGLALLFGTGGAAPIDSAMRPLSDLQQQLAKLAATTTRSTTPAAGEDPAVALKTEALRQPQPLQRWLVAMATGGAALRDGGPRGAMIVAWNAPGGPGLLCPATIADKFPFAAQSTNDATLEDFTKLFGPGGAIDAFFNSQLKPYVDMNAKPWKLQAVDNVNAPLTAGDLAQFQRAAAIRDLFFPGGSATPVIRFDLTLAGADPQATGMRFETGTTALASAGNTAPRPAALTWPGKPPATAAHLTISGPQAQTQTLTLDGTGPWALFRLLAKGKAQAAGDKVTVTFTGSDRTGKLELKATPNPFASTLLTEFRCPAVQ